MKKPRRTPLERLSRHSRVVLVGIDLATTDVEKTEARTALVRRLLHLEEKCALAHRLIRRQVTKGKR